jgi:hypothetical protein
MTKEKTLGSKNGPGDSPAPTARDVKALAERAVGIVMRNEDGSFYVIPAKFTPEKRKAKGGGRPPWIARDVSLLLHFEYLTKIEKISPPAAHRVLAGLFHLQDESRIPATLRRANDDYLKEFSGEYLLSTGVTDEKGEVDGRMLAIFKERDSVRQVAGIAPNATVEINGRAFIVSWGERTAHFGLLTGGSGAFAAPDPTPQIRNI